MRIKTIVLASVLSVFFCRLAAPTDTPDQNWFPFVLSEKMDEASPANIGRLVLDAPAGKHGFLKTKDRGFYFEDGTPVKFWGTNLGSYACFPDKKDAKTIADRLAFYGFNAVRIHHLDLYDEPGGIFKDIHRFDGNSKMKTTRRLSEGQLDRLDYLIYQLEQKGIYIDMNLLVARHFTPADGVAAGNQLGMAAKPVSLFDPKLIELQKEYAKDLLAHKNPYTGLVYTEDPALVLVEINNENSIFQQWGYNNLNGPLMGQQRGTIPAYYVNQLDTLWNLWLKEKYSSAENTRKAWSEEPLGPQEFRFKRPLHKLLNLCSSKQKEDIQDFYVDLEARYFEDMIYFLRNDLQIKVPITGIGGYIDPLDVKAQQGCDFIDMHTYWDHPGFPHGWNPNDFTMSGRSMLKNNKLGMIGDILDSPVKDKPLTITEWNHCYPNSFAYESPALMAAMGSKNSVAALFQFAYSPGEPFDPLPKKINSFFHIAGNPQQLILCSIGSLVYLEARESSPEVTLGKDSYEIKTGHIRGAVGFIKNRDLLLGIMTIRSHEDGAVFIYTPDQIAFEKSNRWILVAIGQTKDTGSEWQDKRFNWGSSPSLLKNMSVSVSIPSDKPLMVYELDAAGKRGGSVKTVFKDGQVQFSIKDCHTPWFEITKD